MMRRGKHFLVIGIVIILMLSLLGCGENASAQNNIPIDRMQQTSSTDLAGTAASDPLIGDADNDGSITISDATTIQRYLADIATPSFNEEAADADQDGEVTITDATIIQRYLAEFDIPNCYVGKRLSEIQKPADTQTPTQSQTQSQTEAPTESIQTSTFYEDSLVGKIPYYSGQAYYVINNNEPFFTNNEKKSTDIFEKYSELDNLGRCGVAYASICKQLMPTEQRGDISSVTPSGWKYNGKSNNNDYGSLVDGGRIYNRCHLIGFQLAGENDNNKNLVTGTRYMNVIGMLPFENMIDDYVDETNGTVLYRVTPLYNNNDLVCKGVLMEAWSTTDNGDSICFNVFCYNIQPGITINYATGQNWLSDESPEPTTGAIETHTYILNTNSKKFHNPDCSYAANISAKNRQEYNGTRDDLINQGYSPCGSCKP